MNSTPRILNVDDDEVGRFAVTQMLRSAGFEVMEAATGMQALEKAAELPDIMLLDVRMPDIDGFEVCRRIKANPRTAGITVLHLSATQVDSQAIAHGLNWGADGYLTEPVTQSELVATVRAFLRIRRAEAAQRLLAEASAELASVLGGGELMAKLAAITSKFFGVLCIVDTLDERGQLRTVAVEWGPRDRARSAALARDFSASGEPGIVQVAQTGQAVIGSCVADNARLARALAVADATLLDGLVPCTFLSAPLHARTRKLGVITVVARTSEREFAPGDLTLLEELAARSALLLDNARLYEQAQKAIATRENMLAIVSHDLKDPLNSLLMGCEMLLEATTDPVAQRRLEIMRRSAQRMDRLIHDLLDLASLDGGTFSVRRSTCSIELLLKEVFETFQPLAAEKDIELTRQVDAHLPEVACDRGRVYQVLSNLLSNALKFTPRAGRVRLEVEGQPTHVIIRVIDTGPGLAPDDLPHVFDRFWQANRNARLGTGLGLSIAKGIVEAHGGVLSARSSVGAGSTFEFTLPVKL